MIKMVHRSLEFHRAQWSEPEAVFAYLWEQQNSPPSWVNGGYGTLELLLRKPPQQMMGVAGEVYFPITQEHASVAATVVQWLGTNCGRAFLIEALTACGFELSYLGDSETARARDFLVRRLLSQ